MNTVDRLLNLTVLNFADITNEQAVVTVVEVKRRNTVGEGAFEALLENLPQVIAESLVA